MKQYKELEELAISIRKDKTAQFFYGDNIEGYFEGFAGCTGGGSGYWLQGQPCFQDAVAFVGRHEQIRKEADGADILPQAIRHRHAGCLEEIAILHRQRTVAMTVQTEDRDCLGLAPLFDPGAGEPDIRETEGGFVLSFKNHPLCAGLAATSPVQWKEALHRDGMPGILFETQRKARELTLYLAYDISPEKALARALDAVNTKGRATHDQAIRDFILRSRIETGKRDVDKAVAWAKLTSYFLVSEEFGKGIWAGLPWFKNNWGRDTFIAFPGTLLVTGMFDDAREVILNFLRYQDQQPDSPTYGRVPNRIAGENDIIYNTTDGTPWLIRELYEYLQYTGDLELARQVYPRVQCALDGAIEKHVDAEGFLTHDDADTWMDARIAGDLPWSARGNRANDIQALWHNALLVGAHLAKAFDDEASFHRWNDLATTLRNHFLMRFWNPDARVLADRITADGRRDEKVRPNQLMTLSIPMIEPLLNEDQEEAVVQNAVSKLLYPYGIASLSQDDPYFHPYHHTPEHYHYDAAYHNGTVWGWNAGFTITALCRRRQTRLAGRLAENLANQILRMGCRGSMSELVEAIPRTPGEIALSGTWAQAWSTSEFARNAFQDFGGFHPRLLDGEIHLTPHLPDGWPGIEAVFPFGKQARLHLQMQRTSREIAMRLLMEDHPSPLTLRLTLDVANRRFEIRETLRPNHPMNIRFASGEAIVDGDRAVQGQKLPDLIPLDFLQPDNAEKAPSMREKDYLQQIIEKGAYR